LSPAPRARRGPLLRRRLGARARLAPHAIKRLSEPEEVAETVAFLLGPNGASFTGATVVMDQGWSAS